MKTMDYKGFTGSIEFSQEDNCYYGKLLNINGLELYEGDTLEELETAFQEAVDDYIVYLEQSKIKAV